MSLDRHPPIRPQTAIRDRRYIRAAAPVTSHKLFAHCQATIHRANLLCVARLNSDKSGTTEYGLLPAESMAGKIVFDGPAIRKLVQQRVDASSLRDVADDIGLSKSGLDSFLKGRDPYSRNRARLATWYARQTHPVSRSVDRREVDAAIALLERYFESGSETVRDRRVREVAERLFKANEAKTRKPRGNAD
jgi:hypothetical protein